MRGTVAGIRTPGNTKDVELLSWTIRIGNKSGLAAYGNRLRTEVIAVHRKSATQSRGITTRLSAIRESYR